MSKAASPPKKTLQVRKKNHIFTIKNMLWLFEIFSFYFALAGSSVNVTALFLILSFFAACIIFQNSDKKEQLAIAIVFIALLGANAWYIFAFPGGREPTPDAIGAGIWIANKLVYVVGLAYFVPVLVEPWVKTPLRQTIAIVLACALQFWPFVHLHYERKEASKQTIQCAEINIERKTCTPIIDKNRPWYPLSVLREDVAFGLEVILLIAAFNAGPAIRRTLKQNPIKTNAGKAPHK